MKKLIIILFALMVIPSVVFACPKGQHESNGTCVPDGSSVSWLNWIPKVQYVDVWNNTISWLTSHFTQGRVVCSKESHLFSLDMYSKPFVNQGSNYGYEISLGETDAFDSEGNYLHKRTFHTVEFSESLKGYYCRTISDLKGVELVSQEFRL